MQMNVRNLLIACLLPCATAVAHADVYNFEAQAVGAPSSFTNTLNSPLVIGNATFGGGQLLLGETFSPDATGVYATNGYGIGYDDELTIAFGTGMNEVSLVVTNNTAGTFYVSDNVGDFSQQLIGTNGSGTFTLIGSGITGVTITEGATAPGLFDFAIDNVATGSSVGAGPATSATPEPGTAGLVVTGMGALAGLVRRKRR